MEWTTATTKANDWIISFALFESHQYTHLLLRYVFRWEMVYLLELCGFEIESLYGDFNRGPFKTGFQQIWIAKRP